MIKISIIIPTHNSASYMRKCINSCIAQTLENIEIIVVDDCSSDDSVTAIKEYMETYPSMVRGIFLDVNIRQGGARNVGIRAAQGEYLLFVDSDDWIEPDMCETLWYAAQGADLCGGDYFISTDDSDKKINLDYPIFEQTSDRKLREQYLQNYGMFWTRIYRRRFLVDHDLFFPEGTFYEDAWFNFMTGLYAQSIHKTQGCFYHYYQRSDSTMHSRNKVHQYERIGLAIRIYDDCRDRGMLDPYRDAVEAKFIGMMAANILYTCLGQFDVPDVEKLQEIRQAVSERCPHYRKTRAYHELNRDLKRYLRWTMHSPKKAVWLYTHHVERFYAYSDKIGDIFRRKRP